MSPVSLFHEPCHRSLNCFPVSGIFTHLKIANTVRMSQNWGVTLQMECKCRLAVFVWNHGVFFSVPQSFSTQKNTQISLESQVCLASTTPITICHEEPTCFFCAIAKRKYVWKNTKILPNDSPSFPHVQCQRCCMCHWHPDIPTLATSAPTVTSPCGEARWYLGQLSTYYEYRYTPSMDTFFSINKQGFVTCCPLSITKIRAMLQFKRLPLSQVQKLRIMKIQITSQKHLPLIPIHDIHTPEAQKTI